MMMIDLYDDTRWLGYAPHIDRLVPFEPSGPLLVDLDWFNDLILSFNDQEKARQLRDSLGTSRLPINAPSSSQRISDLKRSISDWHQIDLDRDEERWCRIGFRHRLADGQYSRGSTLGMLLNRWCPRREDRRFRNCECDRCSITCEFYPLIELAHNGSHVDCEVDDHGKWCVPKALTSLATQLEEVACLLDRQLHDRPVLLGIRNLSYASGYYGMDWRWSSFWTVDILSFVCMELSLKTLWSLQHPDGNPAKDIVHDCKTAYDDLRECHAAIREYICDMPVMWGGLQQDMIDRMFEMMPSGNRLWNRMRYSPMLNWKDPDDLFAMFPYAQFGVAVAVFFVTLSVLSENTGWSRPRDAEGARRALCMCRFQPLNGTHSICETSETLGG